MPSPFKATEKKADVIETNSGRVYDATLDEMGNIPELLRSLNSTVMQYGAVVVRPLDARKGPFNSSTLATTVETSKQRLPNPPFALQTKTRQGSDSPRSADDLEDEEGIIQTDIALDAHRKQ